jgi:hypothetical protein
MTPQLEAAQRAIALVEQLSADKLTLALEFLENLIQKETDDRIDEFDLSAMANDSDIQTELSAIQQEFANTEMDGLATV